MWIVRIAKGKTCRDIKFSTRKEAIERAISERSSLVNEAKSNKAVHIRRIPGVYIVDMP